MTAEEMCNTCAHVNYCMCAYKKDHWCGNWVEVVTMKCPKCGKSYPRLLTVSREDNCTMICDMCGVDEALASAPRGVMTPQEKTKARVMASGNKWAIENFNATHG